MRAVEQLSLAGLVKQARGEFIHHLKLNNPAFRRAYDQISLPRGGVMKDVRHNFQNAAFLRSGGKKWLDLMPEYREIRRRVAGVAREHRGRPFTRTPQPDLTGLSKLSAFSRRGFLDQFLNVAKAAPKAYVQNTVANVDSLRSPAKMISRRTFLPTIPRAGLAAHASGLDRLVVQGARAAGSIGKHFVRAAAGV